jgi:hypothetical protein
MRVGHHFPCAIKPSRQATNLRQLRRGKSIQIYEDTKTRDSREKQEQANQTLHSLEHKRQRKELLSSGFAKSLCGYAY